MRGDVERIRNRGTAALQALSDLADAIVFCRDHGVTEKEIRNEPSVRAALDDIRRVFEHRYDLTVPIAEVTALVRRLENALAFIDDVTRDVEK